MKKLILLWGLLLSTSISAVLAQEAVCPANLDEPLNAIISQCDGTDRNQVCLGFGESALESHFPVTFQTTGDHINANVVNTLNLDGSGIFSRLQVNYPEDQTGQNLDLIAWGDVTITNNTPPIPNVTATTTANARARRVPFAETETSVINVIPAGITVQVLGRNAYSDWLYVQLGDFSTTATFDGWVSTQVLTVHGDRNTLPEIDYENPPLLNAPMSSLTIQTGDAPNPCADFPPSGVLLRADPELETAYITINGVDVSLKGVAFIDAPNGNLNIYQLDGRGSVLISEEHVLLVGGTKVSLSLDADGLVIADETVQATRYDAEFLAPLAGVQFADAEPEFSQPLVIADPIADSDIPAQVEAIFAPSGLFEGIYTGWYETRCTEGPSTGLPSFEMQTPLKLEDNILYIWGEPVEPGGDGRYYVITEGTSSGGIRSDGSTAYREYRLVSIYEIVSPTELRYIIDNLTTTPIFENGYATYDKTSNHCTGNVRLDWQSP